MDIRMPEQLLAVRYHKTHKKHVLCENRMGHEMFAWKVVHEEVSDLGMGMAGYDKGTTWMTNAQLKDKHTHRVPTGIFKQQPRHVSTANANEEQT
jgi:hypothetical protein